LVPLDAWYDWPSEPGHDSSATLDVGAAWPLLLVVVVTAELVELRM